jgi:hypothetical protein
VFKKKALRRVFGAKKEHVTVDWRKLHYEKLTATIRGPLYSAKTKNLNGRPLLGIFLVDTLSGCLVSSASHCALTIINFGAKL